MLCFTTVGFQGLRPPPRPRQLSRLQSAWEHLHLQRLYEQVNYLALCRLLFLYFWCARIRPAAASINHVYVGSTASFVSARQSTRSSPTDYLKISTRLDVSTIRATTSEFGDGGTTSTAARFSTNTIATNSIVPFIITTSSLAFNSLEMSPSISVSTLRGPAGSGTSSVAQLTTPSLSSPFGNYTTLLVVVGIAGMFLILLLIAIAIIILLVAKKRRNSGKLVLQHGLQDLCSPGNVHMPV